MSTQEYTKATAKISGRKLPIVVVPGIMGSRLTDPATNKLVWNPTGFPVPGGEPGAFAANKARLAAVSAPLVPDETHKHAQVADRVRVDPINHFYNLISAFYGDLALGLHYDLRNDLAAKKIIPAVYCCGYDWRQDNDQAARRLSTIVDEAQADCDGEKVILVAHSMGGLVSRHYCKNLGGEAKVRTLFLLGSPTLGAVKAYLSMRSGLDFFDVVRRALNMGRAQTKSFMRNMQSAYQLLPTFIYCSRVRTSWATFDPDGTGFRDKTIPGGPGVDPMKIGAFRITDNANSVLFYRDIYTGQREDVATRDAVDTQLVRANAFHNDLTIGNNVYMHPATFTYFCDDKDTAGNVQIKFEGVTVLPSGDIVVSAGVDQGAEIGGDGTVPGDSGNPAPVTPAFIGKQAFSGVEHTKLSSNPAVINRVRSQIVELV